MRSSTKSLRYRHLGLVRRQCFGTRCGHRPLAHMEPNPTRFHYPGRYPLTFIPPANRSKHGFVQS